MTTPSDTAPPPTGFIALVREVISRFGRHNVTVIAAGISFYAVLAIVPTIIAGALIFARVVEPSELETELLQQTESLSGTTRTFVQETLIPSVMTEVSDARGEGTTGVLLALLLALWSASGAVQKLMKVTAAAYEAEETRSGWKMRLLAYGATAAAIVILGLLVVVLGLLPLLGDQLGLGDATQTVVSLLTYPVVALIIMGSFTLLYRYSPDRSPRTPWINPGAIVATIGFLLIAYGFSAYSGAISSLGATAIIGSVAVLMLFFQFSTIAAVVGAEINAVVENARAVRVSAAEAQSSVDQTDETTDPNAEEQGVSPVKFWQALAGVITIFALGRTRP